MNELNFCFALCGSMWKPGIEDVYLYMHAKIAHQRKDFVWIKKVLDYSDWKPH